MDKDNPFMQVFPYVLGFLVIFTVGIFIIARNLAPDARDLGGAQDPRVAAMIKERIAPAGRIRTEMPTATTESLAASSAAGEMLSGEAAYNQSCAACHASGVMGAPKFGSAEDWVDRAYAGLDAMVVNAIKGIGGMPPRGGSALKDEEIRAAIEYMTAQ